MWPQYIKARRFHSSIDHLLALQLTGACALEKSPSRNGRSASTFHLVSGPDYLWVSYAGWSILKDVSRKLFAGDRSGIGGLPVIYLLLETDKYSREH